MIEEAFSLSLTTLQCEYSMQFDIKSRTMSILNLDASKLPIAT